MAFANDFDDVINSLKAKMVCSDFIVLESTCSADMADAVDAQVNNNSESTPLLHETQQEFRHRVCEPSGSYSLPSGSYSPPGPNQPFDSSTSSSSRASSRSAAAAAAKSLQSCPTLCDPINGSPPGSSVPGILQARTLEWVAISF